MIPPILQRVSDAGYDVYDNGSYDLNIIGIRSAHRTAGAFDDWVVVVCKDANGLWVCHWMQATTDPGVPWLESPSRPEGCAILVPGQYKGYELALHRGKYIALCQRKKVKVYRDDNKDAFLDLEPESIQEGLFGINIHRSTESGSGARTVGRFSAGCTVIKSPKDYAALIELCERQIQYHPTWTTFTYTLLQED